MSSKFTADIDNLYATDRKRYDELVDSELTFLYKIFVSDKDFEIPTWDKVFIVSTILDPPNMMYPGAVREFSEIVADIIEGKLSPIFFPSMILKYSYRDFIEINDENVSFRRCLLKRLVKYRKSKSVNKTRFECEDFILVGYWRNEEDIKDFKDLGKLMNKFEGGEEYYEGEEEYYEGEEEYYEGEEGYYEGEEEYYEGEEEYYEGEEEYYEGEEEYYEGEEYGEEEY